MLRSIHDRSGRPGKSCKTVLYLGGSAEAVAAWEVCRLLKERGFHLIKVYDQHAIPLCFAAGINISLVIMDGHDGDGDTYYRLRSIRKCAPHVPVIALSHLPAGLKDMNAQYLGEREYLEMHVDYHDLLRIVQQATGGFDAPGENCRNAIAPGTARNRRGP